MRKAILMLAMAVAGVAAAGVYDDAIFWFRGGKTLGTGSDVTLFDEMHANDPAHANHGAQFSGRPESRAIVEEDVVFPCWRYEPFRTKVLRLTYDPIVDGTTTNIWQNWAYAKFLRPQFSNEYTMVMRLKYQVGPLDNSTRWLSRFGYNGGTGGVLFGLRGTDSNTNRVLLCCYQKKNASGNSEFAWGQTTVRVPPTNVWFDVSLMVSNNILRVGVARPGVYWSKNVIEFATISDSVFPTMTTGWDDLWRFFSEKGDKAPGPLESNDTTQSTFVGSVQQIAIWNHALSDDQIREAWGTPGVDLWQVGLSNGASNEFAADAAPAEQTIDPYRGWSTVSPRLKAGAIWTIPFKGLPEEAGLSQLFRFTPTSGSAEGLVAVSVNGTPLGSKVVRKDHTTDWYADGSLFRSGSNTLTLKRTDTGSSDIVVDTMSLGGSWQIGSLTIGDWSNLQSEGRTDSVPTTFDISRKHWPQANNLSAWTSNRTYRVWVPESVAARYPTAFGFYAKACEVAAGNTGYLNLYVNGDHRALLRTQNGVTKTVEAADSTAGTTRIYYETGFEPGELQAGWNTFELRGHKANTIGAGKGYFLFNALRWFITGHPASSTMLIIR